MQLIKILFKLQKWCREHQLLMAAALIQDNKTKIRELKNDITTLEYENIELRETYLS